MQATRHSTVSRLPTSTLPISDDMRQLIMRNGNALEIAELAQKEGVRNLRQSGLIKVKAGVMSLEEVEACTNE